MRGMAREYAAGNSRGPGWREFAGKLGLLCRKRDLNGDLRIQNPSLVLIEALRHSEQFLHITVDNALNQEVAAW